MNECLIEEQYTFLGHTYWGHALTPSSLCVVFKLSLHRLQCPPKLISFS